MPWVPTAWVCSNGSKLTGSNQTPNCHSECTDLKKGRLQGWRETLSTPKGKLQQIKLYVPELDGVAGFGEHYVKKTEDYEVLLSFLEDVEVVQDLSEIEDFHHRIGEGGIPHVSLPRTPYQALWIEWVSIEDLILHMQDEPAILEQVMTLFGKILIEALEVTADAVGKAEFYHVTLGDNITAPMVGRKLFQKWCMPYYNRASDTLLAKKIHFFVHMDGDLKPLWEDIDQCRHHGIDSLSPPPGQRHQRTRGV